LKTAAGLLDRRDSLAIRHEVGRVSHAHVNDKINGGENLGEVGLATTVLANNTDSIAGNRPVNGTRVVALLGKLEMPTDGVQDYCHWLGLALARAGWEMDHEYLPWPKGWAGAFAWLWRESKNWKGRWVCLQYTAFSWSRTGFSVGLVAALFVLRKRGARCAIVLHDPGPCAGNRWIDKLRRSVQVPILKMAYRLADRSIFTIDLAKATWLNGNREKAVFIPVGANLPGTSPIPPATAHGQKPIREISVFCFTGGSHALREAEDIAYAVRKAAQHTRPLRVVVLGRNAELGEGPLRQALAGSGVEVEVHGVLPAEAVEQRLSQTDVQIFVRGGISTRRGSAIAGIACGLPVVAYAWRETGPPVTDSGVVLVPSGDRAALAEGLTRVLADDTYREQLRQRSLLARQKYFSWDAIAARFKTALEATENEDGQESPPNMRTGL
jgi:glycosyltransferase involved in cell wall biosynthesis